MGLSRFNRGDSIVSTLPEPSVPCDLIYRCIGIIFGDVSPLKLDPVDYLFHISSEKEETEKEKGNSTRARACFSTDQKPSF